MLSDFLGIFTNIWSRGYNGIVYLATLSNSEWPRFFALLGMTGREGLNAEWGANMGGRPAPSLKKVMASGCLGRKTGGSSYGYVKKA